MEASSSRLPDYTASLARPKDAISAVLSLSALHPDPSHPAHEALLSNIDLRTDSALLFAFSQGGIVVFPEDAVNDERGALEEEKSSSRAAGYFQVASTTSKLVKHISIKLLGRQSLAFPEDRGSREEDVVFEKEVGLNDVQLERGINTFEFLISIPSDIAVHEHSSFMELRYYTVGTVVGGTKGLFGSSKDLVAEEEVFIGSASSDLESLHLNIHSQNFTSDLGPCSVDASSSLFLVGGAAHISLTLHSPPPTLEVYALKCFIVQQVLLTSHRDPTKTATVTRPKGMMFEEGWEGPYDAKSSKKHMFKAEGEGKEEVLFDGRKEGTAAGSWTFEKVARVPTDFHLRGSTYPKTKTGIRISSELVLNVYFTTAPPPSSPIQNQEVYIATILRRPVLIGGCGTLPGRLSLPDYTPDPEVFVPFKEALRKADGGGDEVSEELSSVVDGFELVSSGPRRLRGGGCEEDWGGFLRGTEEARGAA